MRKSNRGGLKSRKTRANEKAPPVIGGVPAVIYEPPELPPLPADAARDVYIPPALPPELRAVSASTRTVPAVVYEPPELPPELPVNPPREDLRPVRETPAPVVRETVRPAVRPRLVFAVDATASRHVAWGAATRLTDAILQTLPGELDVALAVHGGNKVHTFTRFTSDAGELREMASGVVCKAGHTRLLDILARVIELDHVAVVAYIGDMFEENAREARRFADALRRRGTRVIVLHDTSLQDHGDARAVFETLASRTGGAVLPFNISALEKLIELVEAVAVLAVGGTGMLEKKAPVMKGAGALLRLLAPPRH
jgi:hypothetical protein